MKIFWTHQEWKAIADRLYAKGVLPDERGWRGHLVDAMKSVLPKEKEQ